MAAETRELAAEFSKVDFKAGKKEERGDAKGGHGGDDSAMSKLLEKNNNDDSKGEARERRRQAKALESSRDNEESKDSREFDQSPSGDMQCVGLLGRRVYLPLTSLGHDGGPNDRLLR
jgi:hypothetical protein